MKQSLAETMPTTPARGRGFTLAAILALGGLLPGPVLADDDYSLGKAAWLANDYETAYTHLTAHRQEVHGRRAEVDFMLGTSACRASALERRRWGQRVLDWMLYAYHLDSDGESLVLRERSRCLQSPKRIRTSALAVMDSYWLAQAGQLPGGEVPGMRARGKEFTAPDNDVRVSSYSPRRLREISREEFQSRRTLRGEPVAASRKLDKLVATNRIITSDRFLVASLGDDSQERLEGVADTLETFWAFLERAFDVPEPQHYISVLLVPRESQLRQLADRLHGLDVSPATIGYSFRDDLTLLALSPKGGVGTLLHETFHLAAHRNFGDIPLWLDEGIATLYEVADMRPDGVFGRPNWRARELRLLWSKRPSVEELIGGRWSVLGAVNERGSPDRGESESRAAFAATARYFALYLQESGDLTRVYRAFRDHGFEVENDGTGFKGHKEYALVLAERELGVDRRRLQADFDGWLAKEIGMDATADPYPINAAENAALGEGGGPNFRGRLEELERRLSEMPEIVIDLQDLAGLLAEHSDLSPEAARRVLQALFGGGESMGIIPSELARRRTVRLEGFGEFVTKMRPGRIGRNPATGDQILINAKIYVTFRPAQRLKDIVAAAPKEPEP